MMLSQNNVNSHELSKSLNMLIYRHGHDMGNSTYRMEDVDMVEDQVEDGGLKNFVHDFS